MSLMVIYRTPDVDRETYPKIIRGTATNWPEGAVAHFAGFSDDGLCVVDVWESRAQFEAFLPKLRAVLQDVGVPWADPEIYELEGTIAVESFGQFVQQLTLV